MFRKSQANFFKSFVLILFFFAGIVFAFQGGDGSLGDPYQISNCIELQNMSQCLSCNYTLVGDVDCGIAPYNTGKGFMPIGNCTVSCYSGSDEVPFAGSFDGQNNKIQNLFINRPSQEGVGLFGMINSLSLIKNINLINVDIVGNITIGALVGNNYYGNINSSYSSGSVDGNFVVGGLVGDNYYGSIDNSYSSGSVTGNNFSVGGLVGYNYFGNIDNSYSIASVIGDRYVGGLIGVSYYGSIDNSYSAGSVTGVANIGGLVGYNDNGNIDNSYSVGSVTGTMSVGGLIGEDFFGVLTNLYWNNYTGNPNSSIGLTNPLETNPVQNNISYFYDCSNEPMASWDTVNDWTCSGLGLPQLAWAYVPPASPPSSLSSIFPFENVFSLTLTIFIMLSYLFLS